MDAAEEEKMELKQMLERIAELEHSQSQFKRLNTEMRHLLETADDEVAELRLENTALINQVKILEKSISDAEQDEVELCRVRTLLAEEQNIKSCNVNQIKKLENKQMILKEQNEKITAELNSLQHQRDQNKINISSLRAALKTLQYEMEETQLGLKHRDDVIHQQNLQLRHLEESTEESSNIIRDLRLRIQDLKNQLEIRHDDASCAGLDVLMAGKDGSPGCPLSFAEEMELLASSVESIEVEEQGDVLKLDSPAVKVQTKSRWCNCAERLAKGARAAGTFTLSFLALLCVLASVAPGISGDNTGFFSIHTLWSRAHYLLQPYCNVDHVGLPPI